MIVSTSTQQRSIYAQGQYLSNPPVGYKRPIESDYGNSYRGSNSTANKRQSVEYPATSAQIMTRQMPIPIPIPMQTQLEQREHAACEK
jgi:hypothetical protein